MEDLALYANLFMLFGLMYIILAEPRKKVASEKCTCQYPDCQHRNPCRTDGEVTNPPTLKSDVPKPPPVTDPSIIDYYYHYCCYYHNYHYPNYYQTDSEDRNPPPLTTGGVESDTSHSSPYPNACQDYDDVPEPPPATDPSIVYYYYYFYSYYYFYHYPDVLQTNSEVTNPPSSTTESSRHVTNRARRSGHQKKRPNEHRSSQGLYLEICLHDQLGIQNTSADQSGQVTLSVSA
ncbi:hypothetical protein IFM46972_04907 [Aspergillus udagawae]|uniref:Uncharacterized protein n=1 Tax=Aspergillus udagawae TaxID=91492 RepID=A0A8H3NLT4_9EURO|nr:hypothetical protein IFM46972_04907 [Aspergillus udagawae]